MASLFFYVMNMMNTVEKHARVHVHVWVVLAYEKLGTFIELELV